jgi:hypothetical protein
MKPKQSDRDRPDAKSPLDRWKAVVRWSSILCLLVIVHLTHNRISEGIAMASVKFPGLLGGDLGDFLVAAAPTAKALFFIVSLIALSGDTVGEVWRALRSVQTRHLVSALLLALIITVVLGVLVVPEGNVSMGTQYAERSMHPFEQNSDWLHKRLLMPAMAYLLFLSGNKPYFVFGFLITVVFIALLHGWLRKEAPLPFIGLLSLCTSSFVIYQFQAPGYPDILVFCFLLGVMFANLSEDSKFVLLVLALLTHEASLFVGLPLAWRFLDRRRRVEYLSVVVLYGFVWLAASRFRLVQVLGSHNVQDMSGIEWVLQNPWLEVAGIFFAFKALWLLPIVAIALAAKQGESTDSAFILICIAAAIVLTTVGVDCSRMAGYGFPAILMSLKLIMASPRPRWTDRALSGLFVVNLLIPSYRVGLNAGIRTKRGLYRVIHELITSR